MSDTEIAIAPLDSDAFDAAEAIIERGQATFKEVGRAIMVIRDGGKEEYRRRGYSTFEDYMQRRWGWTARYGYMLMDAVEVVENVTSIAEPVPPGIHHAHILAPLAPEQQRAAWHAAVRTSPDGKPRVSDLRKVVKTLDAERRAEQHAARAQIERPSAPDDLPVRIEVADATQLPLEDASVDLIVTSPPYGLEKPYLGGTLDLAGDWQAFMADWLPEAWRVARLGGRLALNVPLDTTAGGFWAVYAQAVTEAVAAGWTYRSTLLWHEGNITHSTGRGSVDSPAAPHVIAPVEMVALFCKGDWKRSGDVAPDITHDEWLDWTNGVWTFSGEGRAWEQHPAAFPEELPRRLITLLSFPGDTVLDPFCGSGTTPLVAHRLGRVALGFDVSPEYVASARRRFVS